MRITVDDEPDSSKEGILESLQRVLSDLQQTNRPAEQCIEAFGETDEFGIHLTNIIIDNEVQLAVRELASTTLNQYIENHWHPAERTYNIQSARLKMKAIKKMLQLLIEWQYTRFEPTIRKFCDKFVQSLKAKTDPVNDISLKIEIIKAINKLFSVQLTYLSNFWPKVWPLIGKTLIESTEFYKKNAVEGGEDTDSTTNRITGAKMKDDCANLVIAILKLCSNAMSGFDQRRVSLQWFYLRPSLSPEELLSLLINFMEMTDKEIKLRLENPVQSTKDKKRLELASSRAVCSAAKNLLKAIVKFPNSTTSDALRDAIWSRMRQEIAMGVKMNYEECPNQWKSREAFLRVCCQAKDIIIRNQGRIWWWVPPINDFLENVVLAEMDSPGCRPFLLCRCLYFGVVCAQHWHMPSKMISRFLKATISGLENKSIIVRIHAARIAIRWLRATSSSSPSSSLNSSHIRTALLRFHLADLFRGLFNLGTRLMSAEVLTLVLENFSILVAFDRHFVVSVEDRICSLTITAFENLPRDELVLQFCKEIFKELTLNKKCTQLLQIRVVPMLVLTMTNNSASKLPNGRIALEVLQILVEHSPEPLSTLLMNSSFPTMCKYVAGSDDLVVLKNGSRVISAYLSVSIEQVVSSKDSLGKTGIEYVLQVAAHLLDVESDECLINDAYKILTFVMQPPHDKLQGKKIDQLLSVTLRKIQDTQTSPGTLAANNPKKTLSQHLRLLVLHARLMNAQFDYVFKFLSTTGLAVDGPNALESVISEGFCRKYELFKGDDRKIVKLAFYNILEYDMLHPDSALQKITFREDILDEQSAYPVRVKIYKLLKNELSEEIERKTVAKHYDVTNAEEDRNQIMKDLVIPG